MSSGNKSLGQFNLEGIPRHRAACRRSKCSSTSTPTASCTRPPRTRAPARKQDHHQGQQRPERRRNSTHGERRQGQRGRRQEASGTRAVAQQPRHAGAQREEERSASTATRSRPTKRPRSKPPLKETEELLKDQNATKEALDAKLESLSTVSQKLGEKMYAAAQAEQAAAGAAAGGGAESAGASGGGGGKPGDDAKSSTRTSLKSGRQEEIEHRAPAGARVLAALRAS